jgi:5-(carboxyamino)imidazole ribonucleotide synthase
LNTYLDWSNEFTLGILGGGQLGKMLLDETSRLGIKTAVLDPAADAPAQGRADNFQTGDLKDYDSVLAFGRAVDVLTFEIEHVNLDALDQLEKEGICVRPSPKLLRIISDKTAQKRFYAENDIPTLPFVAFGDLKEMRQTQFGFPAVWKAATGGYDGRGVQILRAEKDAENLPDVPGLLEEFAEGNRELAVIVARNSVGETVCYDPVEMSFHPTANLVEYLISPAVLVPEIAENAKNIAEKTAHAFDLVGIMAVEMFLTEDGLWVNEVAPRPHNSGHHTIESHYVSQHGQLLRAILDLPLGSTRELTPAVMVNLLGGDAAGQPRYDGLEDVLKLEGCYVHIYGKSETRPFRKMGHVTLIANTAEEALEKARFVRKTIQVNAND